MNKKDFEKIFENEEDCLNARKIFDSYLRARDKYYSVCSDFYNPIFLGKVYKYFNQNSDDIKVKLFGGYDGFERCFITFTPLYIEEVQNFSYIKIHINKFQKELKHRDILGAIVGLGLTREKIGDIIIKEGVAYVVVKTDILDFILENLTYIGSQKVVISQTKNIQDIIKKDLTEKTVTLASLRIDNFVASSTNLSRSKVKELIESEKVFVNYVVVNNFSKELKEGDIITIRGFGRFYFKKCTGQSKKGRLIVKYEV